MQRFLKLFISLLLVDGCTDEGIWLLRWFLHLEDLDWRYQIQQRLIPSHPGGPAWRVSSHVLRMTGFPPYSSTCPDQAQVKWALRTRFWYHTTHPNMSPSMSNLPTRSYSFSASPTAELYLSLKEPLTWSQLVTAITDQSSLYYLTDWLRKCLVNTAKQRRIYMKFACRLGRFLTNDPVNLLTQNRLIRDETGFHHSKIHAMLLLDFNDERLR